MVVRRVAAALTVSRGPLSPRSLRLARGRGGSAVVGRLLGGRRSGVVVWLVVAARVGVRLTAVVPARIVPPVVASHRRGLRVVTVCVVAVTLVHVTAAIRAIARGVCVEEV